MKIAITGASGFVGRRLLETLRGHSLTVLSRSAATSLPHGVRLAVWDPLAGPPGIAALAGMDAVIHLAGEPVAQRWTAAARRRILESRETGTRHLVQGIREMHRPPAALISASAIGYYGSRGDELLREDAAPGTGFLPDVCAAWEQEASAAAEAGVRVAKIRIGIVLSPHGGALGRMLPPFRLGLGGPLGSGRQWMSWIHLEDLVELIRHAVEHPVSGAFNATAPNAVTNLAFTQALGLALHRRAFLPVPAVALRLLLGDMASLLLGSQRAVPAATEAAGFRFHFPELKVALGSLLH
jgi:uncharacterized protein